MSGFNLLGGGRRRAGLSNKNVVRQLAGHLAKADVAAVFGSSAI